MKGQSVLKITSVLMIVCGILAAIVGVIALLGVSVLAALVGSAEWTGLLYASAIIVTAVSVIEVIAGVQGLRACKAPGTAKKCVAWGILIVAASIVSMVIGLMGGSEFSISSLVLNLLVPGLYIYGALQIKAAV